MQCTNGQQRQANKRKRQWQRRSKKRLRKKRVRRWRLTRRRTRLKRRRRRLRRQRRGEEGEEEEEEGEEEAEEEAEEQATARQARITKAMNRTCVQQKDDGGAWRLTVQVNKKASDKHREGIQTIYNAMMQGRALGRSSGDEGGHFPVALR